MSAEPSRERSRPRATSTAVLAAVAWLAAIALAYPGPGAWWAARFEGIDAARIPGLGSGLFALALLLAVISTVRWARLRQRRVADESSAAAGVPVAELRRSLLLGAAATVAGLIASGAAVYARVWGWLHVAQPVVTGPSVSRTARALLPEWHGARIRSYRRLGRTDFAVSDISLGSGAIAATALGEAIAREAIERGVNYFDTAPDYAAHGSETVLGRAMRGVRDRMFVATKFCTSDGHLPLGASVAECMRVVEGSLERLQTDYVDLVHIHACDSTQRLMDENVHEAFDRLREQGKARFLGFSSHTPNLVPVAERAIESGRFDVMMLAYHHGGWPRLADVIDRAAAAEVGVVAMKTLKGAKHRGMREFVGRTDAYSQAAFRWVLSNPSVSCLVVSFYHPQHVDEYLHASGRALEAADTALLRAYDRAIAGSHCLPHCGACLSQCPEGVPIADVLRHRMYFEDYGLEKQAMQQYARLDVRADVCGSCAAPCLGACPVGIPIAERTREAHSLLTLG